MIEVKANRTERTATYHLGGDQYQQRCWSSDIHYDNWDRRGDGEPGWRKCDPIIEVNPGVRAEHVDYQDNGWRVLYMPYNAFMPPTADGVFTFRDCRSVPGERKDIAYTVQPIGALPVPGVVAGLEVVYRDAYGAGADLVYQLRASGVAKLVRVHPTSTVTGPFQFRVSLPAGAKVLRTNGVDTYELDRRGPKQTNMARKTIIEIGGQSTYLYPFRWRSGIDSGVLPVVIEPDGNNWIFTKAIPAEWTREAYVEIDLTATGTSVTDGYMGQVTGSSYTTCRDSLTGNTNAFGDASNTVYGKRGISTAHCVRGAFSWSNTVPASATVTDISHKLTFVSGLLPTTSQWVPWVPSDFVTPTVNDYAAGASAAFRRTAYCDTQIAALSTGDDTRSLNAAAIAAFTKGGTNGYGVMEYTADFLVAASYGGGSVNAQVAFAEHGTPASRPVHTITYTLPTGYQNMMMMGVG